MKKSITIFLGMLLVLVVSSSVIYYWAFQHNLSTEEHAVVSTSSEIAAAYGSTDSMFSIMTYNIGYLSGLTNNEAVLREKLLFDTNMNSVLALLEKEQLDIIAFQEIDYGSSRSYEIDQEQEIAHALQYPYTARAVNWDKRYVPFPYWPIDVQFGKIISGQSMVSKYPIVKQVVDTLVRVESAPFFYNDFYLERLAQICTLQIAQQSVVVINVHMEAFDADTRAKHSQYVLQLYHRHAKNFPTILLGDFNSSPDDQDAHIALFLDQKNLNSVALDAQDLVYTYDSFSPSQRLDYIFYNDRLELLYGKVVKEAGSISDHLPVMASFRLK